MKKSTFYLFLAVIGAVLPYIFFTRFFMEHGLAGNFVASLFVNGAAGGFATDLLISSVVFWIFVFAESRRVGLAWPALYVVINLVIGLSCALPLFLWARERTTVASEATARVLA